MAKAPSGLEVWLYGHHLATLSEPSRFRYRLTFTDEALDVFGEGSRVLSLALPITRHPAQDGRSSTTWKVSAFLEGLLPEGNLLRHVATAAGVPTIDKIGLLRQVGGECAGAVQFLPHDQSPTVGHLRPLSEDEVGRMIADLPTYHLPHGALPQASLAGIQDKVLLTRMPDGSWSWPEDGAASSHIIKPEPRPGTNTIGGLIESEAWLLEVAKAAGLRAAHAALDAFDGRAALVVARYDRTSSGQRLHQEDFCQALGLDPEAKYETTAEATANGSRLSRIARLAADRSHEPDRLRSDLLAAVTFNVITGNGDAHSKNYSLLIDRDSSVSLAPLYDTAPVMYLDDRFRSTGQIIGGRSRITEVTTEVLIEEAATWGFTRARASAVVAETMERVRSAINAVALPDGVDDGIRERIDHTWVRTGWTLMRAPQTDETRVWVEPYVNARGAHITGHWRTRPVRK